MPPWMIGCWIPNSSVIAVFTKYLPLFRSVNDFEQTRRTHAATDAHGHDPVFCLATPALDQEVAGQPRACHAVGMANRDRTAIAVQFFRVDAELVAAIAYRHSIALVQPPDTNTAHPPPPLL